MFRRYLRALSRWDWAILVVILVVTGYQEVRDSSSCAVCRNLKEDRTVRFFWVPLHYSSRTGHAYVVPAGHQHDWFHYSYSEKLGVGGWMRTRVGCATRMYRDNKMPGYNTPQPERARALF